MEWQPCQHPIRFAAQALRKAWLRPDCPSILHSDLGFCAVSSFI